MGIEVKSTSDIAEEYGIKMLVHGPSGSGKTRLCGTTDDHGQTIIISAERGLLSLRQYDIDAIEVTSIREFREAQRYVQKSDYRWVILDSVSEIAEVILEDEKEDKRDARRAYGEMADRVFSIIRSFRNLPCNVVMTAKQGREDDDGNTLHVPLMPGNQLTQNISYMFDEVFALRTNREADGEITSVLQTQRDANFEAKDRSGALDRYEEPDLTHIYNKIVDDTGIGEAQSLGSGASDGGQGQHQDQQAQRSHRDNAPSHQADEEPTVKGQKRRIFSALQEVGLENGDIKDVADAILAYIGAEQFDDLNASTAQTWADAICDKSAEPRDGAPAERWVWANLFALSRQTYAGAPEIIDDESWSDASTRFFAVCEDLGEDVIEPMRRGIKQRHGVDSWKQLPADVLHQWSDLLEAHDMEAPDGDSPRYEFAVSLAPDDDQQDAA